MEYRKVFWIYILDIKLIIVINDAILFKYVYSVVVRAKESDNVKKVKSLIKKKTGVPIKDFYLVANSRLLEDNEILLGYGITGNTSIQMEGKLRGGDTSSDVCSLLMCIFCLWICFR